jgi:outer membrane murein-binding lipoprotein Lpp
MIPAMTEQVENLILEHLRHIRGRVDQLAEDLGTVKLRLTSLETQVSGLQGQVAGLHGDNAIAHQRMDKIDVRLDRIERRLELREPA